MNRKILAALILMAAPALAHNGVDHGAPHHGVIKPFKDVHLEVVAPIAGGVQVYVTDAEAEALPASTLSQVAVEIVHPGAKTEYLDMAIDPTGVFWAGKSAALKDAKSIVRIGFGLRGASGSIEMPGAPLIASAKAAAAAPKGKK